MRTPKTLALLLAERRIGAVERAGDKHAFVYDEEYRARADAVALSYSMPLTRGRHVDPTVSNYLWGLFSDNEVTLREQARRAQVSANAVLQLLSAYGEDLPGAVQAAKPDEIDALKSREGVTQVGMAALKDFVARLQRSPGLTQITEHGGKFSLAGAQPKKALNWTNGKFYEPRGRTPSTHILKPTIPDLNAQVENEHFCLRLASALGLRAARSAVMRIGETPCIIVERFDRMRLTGKKRLKLTDAGGAVVRIHQEDFCQALGVHPAYKYQAEAGPGMTDVMRVLATSSNAREDRRTFFNACVFNFLITGTDAHAKNYSILHLPQGAFRLAPLYDVISALPYEDRHKDRKLAMSVNGEYRYDRITPDDWAREAEACGHDAATALADISGLIDRMPDAASDIASACRTDGLQSDMLDRLVALVSERCATLAADYGFD